MRPVGWILGILGLLLIGFAGGQLLFPRTVVAPELAAEPAPTESIEVPEEAPVPTMPDILGLSEETVARVLSDAQIVAEIVTERAPAAGPEGVVIVQVPAPGAEVTDEVTVTFSESVVMPALVGLTTAEAREVVEQLGAVVQVTREVDPSVVEGTVLATQPAAGEPLGVVVSLTVADTPDALSLAQLRMVERDDCRTIRQSTLNGNSVQDSIECSPRQDAASAEWVLSRRVAALETTIGVADRGDVGSATIRIYADGELVGESAAQYGEASEIRVDLRNIMRMSIEVTTESGEPTVVLGDARLLSTADQLAALESDQ